MGVWKQRLRFVFAIVFGILALIFSVVGYATDYWQEFDVNREIINLEEIYRADINEDLGRYYYSRNRGVFRECYPGDNVAFLEREVTDEDIVDDDCFYNNFEAPDDLEFSDDYDRRTNILRCVVACCAIGIVLLVLSIIVGIIAYCFSSKLWTYIAAVIVTVAGLILGLGIIFYIIMDYMEREETGGPKEMVFRKNWTDDLDKATSCTWEWSFILAWIGVGLALISAIFYIFIARHFVRDDDESDTESSESEDQEEVKEYEPEYRVMKMSQREHPYILNEAFVNPVYWNSSQRGSQYGGTQPRFMAPIHYGTTGGYVPGVSYVMAPIASSNRGSRHGN